MTAPGAGRGATGEAVVLAWLRSDIGLGLKMLLTPDKARPLVEAIDAALAARPSPRDGGAAGEVERLRPVPLTEEQIQARRNHAHDAIVRGLEAKLTAAESRAEAAERRLGGAVAEAFENAAQVADWWAKTLDRHVTRYGNAAAVDIARGIRELATQLGAAALEGGGCRAAVDTPTDDTNPSAEDGHGRG